MQAMHDRAYAKNSHSPLSLIYSRDQAQKTGTCIRDIQQQAKWMPAVAMPWSILYFLVEVCTRNQIRIATIMEVLFTFWLYLDTWLHFLHFPTCWLRLHGWDKCTMDVLRDCLVFQNVFPSPLLLLWEVQLPFQVSELVERHQNLEDVVGQNRCGQRSIYIWKTENR